MNSSMSLVAAATSTQETNTDDPACVDECYLLELMKERSHVAIIISRLPLSLALAIFAGLTVVVTRRTARLTERPSAILVTNLGVTGALIGGIIFLSTILHLVISISFRAMVVLGILLPRTLHIVTTLTLTCLILDRYLALCRPLRYHALLTDTRCYLLVALSWIMPVAVLSGAFIYGRIFKPCPDIRPYIVTYLVLFISAIVAIVAMYFLIAREFRRPLNGSVFAEEMVKVQRRTAKELMMVVMLNLLLAAPDVTMKVFLLSCPKTLPDLYSYHVVPLLLLVHLICFYPLYAWKNLDFRRAMLETFTSFRNSLVRILRRICSVSITQISFVRVSFSRLSRSSTSTVSSSVSTTTTTTTTAPTTTTTPITGAAAMSTSSSSSSLQSVAAVTLTGQDNAVFL